MRHVVPFVVSVREQQSADQANERKNFRKGSTTTAIAFAIARAKFQCPVFRCRHRVLSFTLLSRHMRTSYDVVESIPNCGTHIIMFLEFTSACGRNLFASA